MPKPDCDDPSSWLTPAHPGPYVAVVGPGTADPDSFALARTIGAALARRHAVVINGGMGGIMAASSLGAREAGGQSVGLLPGHDAAEGNEYLSVAVPTGRGEYRNALVVRHCAGMIAVGCSWGTLSEIALAVRVGRPVAVLQPWAIADADGTPVAGPVEFADPEAAVEYVLVALTGRPGQ